MSVKVVKFGGSSLADADHFRQVARIIGDDPTRRYVVPSAPGKREKGDTKVTDLLYQCYELIKAREPRSVIDAAYDKITARYNAIIADLGMTFDLSGELEYVKNAMLHSSGRDYAASRGEYLNAMILAKYLGYEFVDAENVIFFKDNGTLDEEKTNDALAEELSRTPRAVIPGFYGAMPNGTIKTFSRGGSDITGSIVARAVKADLYENWTDVSGFMMADPRIVKDPLIIKEITYRELRELSYMGATVLHEDSIFPVRKAGIPTNIRNTNDPSHPGTMIVLNAGDMDDSRTITGIAGHKNFTLLSVEKAMMNSELGFGRRVLGVLEELGISFEHLPTGIDTMCVVIADSELVRHKSEIIERIEESCHPDSIEFTSGVALIATVGRGMVNKRGTASRLFRALAVADINIRMIDQGSSELNIIVGVDGKDFERAVSAIYYEFV